MTSSASSHSPEGLILVDKPAGMTSHDVVDSIRRRFQIRRVGHGGTLDPAATGLLIVFVGRATKQAKILLEAGKTYLATLRLGTRTDTQDGEGRILETRGIGSVSIDKIEQACARFRGEIEQAVPAYSAVRIQGQRSYRLARAGAAIPRVMRKVSVYELRILGFRLPEVELKVSCSKGTYIRTLCNDIGTILGCGGVLSKLRRTQVGPFAIEQAVQLADVGPEHVLPVETLLNLCSAAQS